MGSIAPHQHKWDNIMGGKKGAVGSVRRCTRCGKSFVKKERVDKRKGVAILERYWAPK